MTTLTIRQKLMAYLTYADDDIVEALYTLLKNNIQEENSFTLSDEQMRILDEEHELYLSGKTKGCTREESIQIIKGQRN